MVAPRVMNPPGVSPPRRTSHAEWVEAVLRESLGYQAPGTAGKFAELLQEANSLSRLIWSNPTHYDRPFVVFVDYKLGYR